MFFKNMNIYITFTWCINQLPLLNTFSFLFHQDFLLTFLPLLNFNLASSFLINFIITYQLDFLLIQVLNLMTVFILSLSF